MTFGELYMNDSGQHRRYVDVRTSHNHVSSDHVVIVINVDLSRERIRTSVTFDPYQCPKYACALVEGGVNSYMDSHL